MRSPRADGRGAKAISRPALLAFFLTFDIHSAVLPLTADLLLLVPHLAAILLRFAHSRCSERPRRGRRISLQRQGRLGAGRLRGLPRAPALLPFASALSCPMPSRWPGSMRPAPYPPIIDQVWRWPARYAGSPVVSDPIRNGADPNRQLARLPRHPDRRARLIYLVARTAWKFVVWAALCYAGVVLGWRFFPRYFFLLLPAPGRYPRPRMRSARDACAFEPRSLLRRSRSSASRRATSPSPTGATSRSTKTAAPPRRSRSRHARPGSTLYVWGYRPEIFVYTGLKPATKYLECQALTGVPADRHLTQSSVVLTAGHPRSPRRTGGRSAPDILIDGLSPSTRRSRWATTPNCGRGSRSITKWRATQGTIIYIRNGLQSKECLP